MTDFLIDYATFLVRWLHVIAATPAVVAALRAATGQPLTRVPVRPTELAGL